MNKMSIGARILLNYRRQFSEISFFVCSVLFESPNQRRIRGITSTEEI